jgi:hypothetical protein
MTTIQRRKQLVEPRLQLKFAGLFLTIASIAILIQMVLLNFMLNRAATALPNDGFELLDQIPGILRDTFLITTALLLPISLVVGIRSTFAVVGPLYRFRVFLRGVIEGEQSEPCRIRKNDELGDLCELLNEATEGVRASSAEPKGPALSTQPPARKAG